MASQMVREPAMAITASDARTPTTAANLSRGRAIAATRLGSSSATTIAA
jgi:hypothetical protein